MSRVGKQVLQSEQLVRTATDEVWQAEQLVRTATDQWDATDFSKVWNCVLTLETSLGSLNTAAAGLHGAVDMQVALQAQAALLQLQSDTVRLQRLVDAAASFLRNLPGEAGCAGRFYQPGGTEEPRGSGSGSWVLEG